jgi:hypothetical protein
MEQRISLITLGVADLKRAAAFYQDVVGWKPEPSPPGVVFFDVNGLVFALWPHAELAKDMAITCQPTAVMLPLTMSATRRRLTLYSLASRRIAQPSSSNLKKPSGADTLDIFPTPTATPGKSPTIHFGPSDTMAACR